MTLSPPAYATLQSDPKLTTLELRVYHQLSKQLDFCAQKPRRVKVWQVADAIRADKGRVGEAIAALIARGYLCDHGRDERNIRRLCLVWSVASREGPDQSLHFVTYPAA